MQMDLPFRAELRVVKRGADYFSVDSKQIPGLHVKGRTAEAAIRVAKKAIPVLTRRSVTVTDLGNFVVEVSPN